MPGKSPECGASIPHESADSVAILRHQRVRRRPWLESELHLEIITHALPTQIGQLRSRVRPTKAPLLTKAGNMASSGPIRVAVLDDYQGFAEPHFKVLDPKSYEVTIFRDTLLPYNHPDTPQSVKDQLVQRLEPFTVISRQPSFLLFLQA